jgi:hypothetical protein
VGIESGGVVETMISRFSATLDVASYWCGYCVVEGIAPASERCEIHGYTSTKLTPHFLRRVLWLQLLQLQNIVAQRIGRR